MTFTPKKPDEMRKLAEARNASPSDYLEWLLAISPAQIIHDADLILSLTKEVEALRRSLLTVSCAVAGWQTSVIKADGESLSVRDYIDRALSTSGRAET